MSDGECRYAIKPYKSHYACFNCRKAFKAREGVLIRNGHLRKQGADWKATCPECGAEMADLGLDFRAPRKNATKQWKAVEELYLNGLKFHSTGWAGTGFRPTSLREAKEFAKKQKRRTAGEQLLGQIASRSKRST